MKSRNSTTGSTKKDKKIVVIGGGTGVFTVLSGLRKYPCQLAAIVSMADDGGSTGLLREEFGILPPGDIRRALVALSDRPGATLCNLFNYRFSEGEGLAGHTFGNLLITALERITGDFSRAVEEAARLLSVKGKVIPVTLNRVKLVARLENGREIKGETNIDVPKHDGWLKIKEVYLNPAGRANAKALKAISGADLIVIGPGDLYTSVIPNLLVKDIPRAIRKSKAKKVYVCNLMTKFGETSGFRASDFLKAIENYLGGGVLDYFIVNIQKPSLNRLKKYSEERADFVEYKKENFADRRRPLVLTGDFLRPHGFLRHDPDKLANVLTLLI